MFCISNFNKAVSTKRFIYIPLVHEIHELYIVFGWPAWNSFVHALLPAVLKKKRTI